MGNKNWWAMMAVTVMLVVACGTPTASTAPTGAPSGAPSSQTASQAPVATASPAAGPAAIPAVPTGYTELDAALGADKPYNGKRVTI